jgi:hypothetical protein
MNPLKLMLAATCLAVAAFAQDVAKPRPAISLTLIPPSPVTEQITLDVRGAVWNESDATKQFAVSVYLDEEKPGSRLHQQTLNLAPRTPAGLKFPWPTKGHAGEHRLLLVAQSGDKALRIERAIEILASEARSTRRLGGAWVDILHHDAAEGRPFDAELAKMTDEQWRELVRAMHETGQDILVITMMFQNFTHRGRHKIETDGYHGKSYYPSKLFPGRMPIASTDPLEAILSEADKLGMHVLPGVGCYAFFDYTPGSLRWCKQVAGELWDFYGHHPSFYGWYLSHESDGSLGKAAQRKEIVEFFQEFTSYVHRLAPDRVVLLAPNCFHTRGAEATYRQLLPQIDIICPFGFHRMPAGDVRGEEVATLMQSLCDAAGCHLWMDLESFVFRNGSELHPRSIQGLVSDFTRFPNFEKTLHYQFPGLMCAPWMSRQPGGAAAVKLYTDYQRFLKSGINAFLYPHAARGVSVSLSTPPTPPYSGRTGPGSLTDGELGESDYRSPAWLGFEGTNVSARLDLGKPVALRELQARFLQFTDAGIFLPSRVEFLAGDDPAALQPLGAARPVAEPKQRGPLCEVLSVKNLNPRARYVEVRATSLGKIPSWHQAAGQKAWLFVDEVLVNPPAEP